MYKIYPTSRFKRDVKQAKKQGKDLEELNKVINILASGTNLPDKYHDHLLSGNWSNHRECHISPDWLLIYKIEKDNLILVLARVGSHSELF